MVLPELRKPELGDRHDVRRRHLQRHRPRRTCACERLHGGAQRGRADRTAAMMRAARVALAIAAAAATSTKLKPTTWRRRARRVRNARGGSPAMRCCLAIAALLVSLSAFADDCDIVLQPAATLLLPYFEVDFKAQQQAATQTLFTIQNTSHLPQIVHVTVWTDWGFAALNLPVFLTGYDGQGSHLYDVFA